MVYFLHEKSVTVRPVKHKPLMTEFYVMISINAESVQFFLSPYIVPPSLITEYKYTYVTY